METKVHRNAFLNPLLEGQPINEASEHDSYSLVCLNSSSLPLKLLPRLWQRCVLKVCADGGANRLFYEQCAQDRVNHAPDAIVGDLDSVEDDVADYYRLLGAATVRDPDQDCNDLDKSLRWLAEQLGVKAAQHTVLVLGPAGGRFDQMVANINALYSWQGKFHRLLLVDAHSTVELLEANVLHHMEPLLTMEVQEGQYCGLLPVGQAVERVTTTGLKWNLQNDCLAFGRLVSTSNTIAEGCEEVTVVASDPLLWTATYDLLS